MTAPIGFGPSTTTGIVLIIKPDLSKSKFKTKKDYFKIKMNHLDPIYANL